jgi:hypothetical protein
VQLELNQAPTRDPSARTPIQLIPLSCRPKITPTPPQAQAQAQARLPPATPVAEAILQQAPEPIVRYACYLHHLHMLLLTIFRRETTTAPATMAPVPRTPTLTTTPIRTARTTTATPTYVQVE